MGTLLFTVSGMQWICSHCTELSSSRNNGGLNAATFIEKIVFVPEAYIRASFWGPKEEACQDLQAEPRRVELEAKFVSAVSSVVATQSS